MSDETGESVRPSGHFPETFLLDGHHQDDSDNSRRSTKWACKELLLTKDFCRDLGKTKTEYMDRGASEEIKPDC